MTDKMSDLDHYRNMANAAMKRVNLTTPGVWHATLGSGIHVCTAIYSDNENGEEVFIADCLPEYALDEKLPLPADHVPNMKFIESARGDIFDLYNIVLDLCARAELAEFRNAALKAAGDRLAYQVEHYIPDPEDNDELHIWQDLREAK